MSTPAESGEPCLSVHDDCPAHEAGVVDQGIGDHNDAAAPLHQVRPLSAFVKAADGSVIGGAVGRTWGRCCELQQLWVHEAWRRRGLGSRLLRAFEARAAQRGCTTFYLETWSFQAPGLYQALGYVVQHTLTGYGPGLARHVMVKLGHQPGAALPPS